MKPSSQAVEEWAKSVASKDKRPLTEINEHTSKLYQKDRNL